MKRTLHLLVLGLFITAAASAQNTDAGQAAVKFNFKYRKGDSYRILSTVQEDVYVNSRLNHHAEILNRISVQVTDVDDEGRGIHDATFMTTESSTAGSRNFSYGEDYKSIFTRDTTGHYEISDEYFMPVVRDVPVFPDKEIVPGEKWTAQGHEAHDLRRTFGIEKPYKVPFNAAYKYSGIEKDKEGRIFHLFDVQYTMYYEVPENLIDSSQGDIPVATQGFSHQKIYWDVEKGYIDHYEETFQITLKTLLNNTFVFAGKANAVVQEFVTTSDQKTVEAVMEKITDLGIADVTVTTNDKGLTISLDNIQFLPDSNILMASEKEKLNMIATILKEFPENDLLITGHTALRGTEQSRKQLSVERAEAVADYLIKSGVKDRYHIFTQGLGAEVPIADNKTEAGRAKNRRVEITIMDK